MQRSFFTYRNFLTLLGLLFAVWFIWNFYLLIGYFFIAGVISLLGRPVVEQLDNIRMGRFRIPRALSALTALLVIGGLLVTVVGIFVPLLQDQAEIISSIDTRKVADSLEEPLLRMEDFILQLQGGDEATSLEGIIEAKLTEWISATSLSNILTGILNSLGSIAVALFSVVFISFFFLRDEHLFYDIIMAATPTRLETQVKNILHGSKIALTRYFGGIILQSTVVILLVTTGLWVMGFEYALLIGFFCGIINVIPYLGPIIGTLFALLVTITTTLNLHPDANLAIIIIKIVALIQGVQLLDNYVSQPIIFSKRMKAHPLEIFFIVLIFGTLAGIPGMIMAVPAYSFLRLVAREFFSEFKIVQRITENMEQ